MPRPSQTRPRRWPSTIWSPRWSPLSTASWAPLSSAVPARAGGRSRRQRRRGRTQHAALPGGWIPATIPPRRPSLTGRAGPMPDGFWRWRRAPGPAAERRALSARQASARPLCRPAGEGELHYIAAVAASTRPRAVEGSYTPCFLAGEGQGRALADTLGVPFYAVSHQQGHLVAAAWSAGRMELLDRPFLAWHLSGGTTELLHVVPDGANVRAEAGRHQRHLGRTAHRPDRGAAGPSVPGGEGGWTPWPPPRRARSGSPCA